jgi:SAM-dependent methyltransferase
MIVSREEFVTEAPVGRSRPSDAPADNASAAESESLPKILHQVAKRAESVLRRLRASLSERSLEALQSFYAQPVCPHIDYDDFAHAFACAYFLTNYWKAVKVFIQEPILAANTVIDLGCGSGATSLAYLAVLESKLAGKRWSVEVCLVDRSREQLRLAEELFAAVRPEFRTVRVSRHYECSELRNWSVADETASVVLLGHVINENQNIIELIFRRGFAALSRYGQMYVIERADDPVWDAIERACASLLLPTIYREASFRDVLVTGTSLVRRPSTAARYVSIRLPSNKLVIAALAGYFRAWRDRSVSALQEVFERDALYYEKPFFSPPVG